jgi:NADH pyrophosphatase NudC (nudix superfamily)
MSLLFSKPTDDPKVECGSCPNCGTYLEVYKDQYESECHICHNKFFIIRQVVFKIITAVLIIILLIKTFKK